jgi:putative hydrolase of the HAD superfamily
MTVEAVVFDWGGTLSANADVDMLDMWRAAARRLAPDRHDELVERLVQVEATAWRWTTTTQRSVTLAELLSWASRELGLDVTDAVLAEAAQSHLDAWTEHIRHDPEAVPTLRALRERNLAIGLLSNTHWPAAFHERFLERDGLLELIDARVYTSDLPWVKPHPAAFTAVLEAIGATDPRRVVFVGDRPLDDIRGARQAGMRAVLRPNAALPPGPVEPDATIESLPELVDIIDRWRSAPADR